MPFMKLKFSFFPQQKKGDVDKPNIARVNCKVPLLWWLDLWISEIASCPCLFLVFSLGGTIVLNLLLVPQVGIGF